MAPCSERGDRGVTAGPRNRLATRVSPLWASSVGCGLDARRMRCLLTALLREDDGRRGNRGVEESTRGGGSEEEAAIGWSPASSSSPMAARDSGEGFIPARHLAATGIGSNHA